MAAALCAAFCFALGSLGKAARLRHVSRFRGYHWSAAERVVICVLVIIMGSLFGMISSIREISALSCSHPGHVKSPLMVVSCHARALSSGRHGAIAPYSRMGSSGC